MANWKEKLKCKEQDYNAFDFRIENASKSQENYLEKLEEQFGDAKISNYTVENKKANFSDPVVELFSLVSNNGVELMGDKIFINPLLFFTRTKNPFNQEVRQMPVYFGYPTQEKFNLSLEIPEGYVVEALPTAVKITSESKDIVYFLNIASQGNKIQISSSKEINSSVFAADQYNGLKELFQKMIVSQNEKIVLKRI